LLPLCDRRTHIGFMPPPLGRLNSGESDPGAYEVAVTTNPDQ